MSLDERKKKILQAVIDAYIDTAEPIGSRTLSKMNDLNLSPATIRNEMSDLEEMGYLGHPHTSAGRIPSWRGYRFYVDSLMERYRLSLEEMEHINTALSSKLTELEQMVEHASRMISELTNYTAIVSTPTAKVSMIKKVEIIPVDENNFLMVIILSDHVVKNRLFYTAQKISPEAIAVLSATLNATVINQAVENIEWGKIVALANTTPVYNDIIEPILRFLAEATSEFRNAGIFLHGTRRILDQPEFKNVSKVKEFLDALDDPVSISKFVSSLDLGPKTKIIIGGESNTSPLPDSSIIICQYTVGDTTGGTIGIIGPTRMDYRRVVSSLEYVAQTLSRLLTTNEAYARALEKEKGGYTIEKKYIE